MAQSLNDWSRNGRKLTMLARNYDAVLRQHARFVVWRRNWSHIVECRSSPEVQADSFPSVLWSSGWVLERLNVQRCMGVAGPEVTRRIAVKEQLNERILNSGPAFPASVLGL